MAKITRVEDAQSLPVGEMAMDGFEVDVTESSVVKSAKLVIKAGVQNDFDTQAQVVAYAGNHLGFGVGTHYQAY